MGFDIGWQWTPLLLAIVAMVGLGAWLLWLDFNRLAHRAFAAFLFFRAGTMLAGVLRANATDAASFAYMDRIVPYLVFPVVPAVLVFILVYPKPRGWLGRRRWAGWGAVAVTVAAAIAYLLDHSLLWTTAPGQGAELVMAGRGNVYTDFGPLILFNALQFPVLALAAAMMTRDLMDGERGSPRFSEFLMFSGFLLNAIFDSFQQGAILIDTLAGGHSVPGGVWGWAFALLPASTAIPTVFALGFLGVYGFGRGADAHSRRQTVGLLAAIPLPLLSFGYLAWFSGSSLGAALGAPTMFTVLGLWRLVLPLLVTYALVRYQLFDVDVRVKWSVKHAPLATLGITLLLFLFSEYMENVLETRWGPIVALGAAGVLTLAAKPLEDIGQRLATRAMPNTKQIGDLSKQERARLFEEQLKLALHDGSISDRERKVLEQLRHRLGMTSSEVARMGIDA